MLVDTDVLIAHLRGYPEARDWLRETRLRTRLAVSAVTLTELTGGMRSAERREVNRLLSRLAVHPISVPIAHRAGAFMRAYRASHTGIGLGDYLIAATAEAHGLPLATLNVRHFPMFEGLQAPFRF